MRPPVIADIADIRALEARPYEAFQPHATVLDALEDATGRYRDRTALNYVETVLPTFEGETWTYDRFMRRVRQAGRLFRELAGEGMEPRVAMLLPAVPEAYFTLFGAEAVGVACPINYLLGPEHIAELIEASGANVVVALGPSTELDIWEKVVTLAPDCPGVKAVVAVRAGRLAAPMPAGVHDFDTLLARQADDPLTVAERSTSELAAMFHTGGTTGSPKLAQHLHRNQLHAAWGAASMYGARETDVCLNGFPLFHVAGSFVYGLSTLMIGGEVVLPTMLGLRNKDCTNAYWRLVEHVGATFLAVVPTVMATILSAPFEAGQLRSVRSALTGGASLPKELADAFEQRTGLPVRNILGMTECGGVIAIEPVAGRRVAGSVGLPLPFTRVTIRDDDGVELPAGQDGIVWLQGPNVGPGYTDQDRNAGTFTEDGWLITGDVGHQGDGGRLFLTGRAKDLIIRSSHNIDPIVIEDALLKHPSVLMAAAVGAPDEYAGEVPVAYVSLQAGADVDAATLLTYARQYIPERPAWPKEITVLPAIPTTAIGKTFKPALRGLAIEAVIQNRLHAAGAHPGLEPHVVTEGRKTVVDFRGARSREDEAQVKAVMAPFALEYRFVDASAMQAMTGSNAA